MHGDWTGPEAVTADAQLAVQPLAPGQHVTAGGQGQVVVAAALMALILVPRGSFTGTGRVDVRLLPVPQLTEPIEAPGEHPPRTDTTVTPGAAGPGPASTAHSCGDRRQAGHQNHRPPGQVATCGTGRDARLAGRAASAAVPPGFWAAAPAAPALTATAAGTASADAMTSRSASWCRQSRSNPMAPPRRGMGWCDRMMARLARELDDSPDSAWRWLRRHQPVCGGRRGGTGTRSRSAAMMISPS